VKHFIGIGHSHLHAVSFGWRDFMAEHPGLVRYTPIDLLSSQFLPTFSSDDTDRVLHPALLDELRSHLPGEDVCVFLCIGGAECFTSSFTPGPSPFDFIDPFEGDGAAPVGQLIPFDLVTRRFRVGFDTMVAVADAVRAVAPVRLVQCAPPPPVNDLPGLMERLPWMATQVPELWRQAREIGVSSVGIPAQGVAGAGACPDPGLRRVWHRGPDAAAGGDGRAGVPA
jgi:hypothetical protein